MASSRWGCYDSIESHIPSLVLLLSLKSQEHSHPRECFKEMDLKGAIMWVEPTLVNYIRKSCWLHSFFSVFGHCSSCKENEISVRNEPRCYVFSLALEDPIYIFLGRVSILALYYSQASLSSFEWLCPSLSLVKDIWRTCCLERFLPSHWHPSSELCTWGSSQFQLPLDWVLGVWLRRVSVYVLHSSLGL